jgi:UDP-N-acetylglucosamine:LPS N-acetylglucosamine transferase
MVGMKICLAFSAGGHRLQIFQLEKIYKKHNYFFLTYKGLTTANLTKHHKVYFLTNYRRNFIKAFMTLLQSLYVFLKEKPDIIISTGAGITVPICYLAGFFGKKVIFIESFSRVTKPSITGLAAYPVSDLFLVQWKPLMKFYKKAVYGGSIF